MARDCENCKYGDIDYIFDEESGEEWPIYTCEKGNDVSFDFECEDFEEYKPKPYVERFTKCDKCECLSQCKSEGEVINVTSSMDDFEHFMSGRNAYCRKDSDPFREKNI